MSEVIFWVLSFAFVSFLIYLIFCLFELKKLKAKCQKMGDELRGIERAWRELFFLRRTFDAYRDEPFITSLQDIDTKLVVMENEIKAYLQQYIQYRGWITRLEKSPWWDVFLRWNAMKLHEHQRKCIDDIGKIRSLRQHLDQLHTRFDQIKEFPWSIALQSREVMEYLHQAKLLMNELIAYGLSGEEFNVLINQVQEIERDIGRIPVYFLSDPYEKLLTAASQEDIREVYQIVNRDLPAILAVIQKADRWKNQYLALDNQTEIAKKEHDRTIQLLTYFPDEVDLSEERSRIEERRKWLIDLEKRLSNIAVDEISNLANEVSDFIHEVQSTQQYLRHNRQRIYQYQRVMQINSGLISQIQERFDVIARSNLIVKWDLSSDSFYRSSELFNRLQSINKPFSFHVLENLDKEALRLKAALSEINSHTARMADMHSKCERMLISAEIKNLNQWIEAARKLAESIRPYDPRNWPNRVWVLNFEKQLHELEMHHRDLAEKLAQKEIIESSMDEFYHLTEEVYRQSLAMRERMSVIEQVFRNVTKVENQSLALLKTTRNQFAQISMFVLSQPLLAEKAEKEIVQLDRKFDLCQASFHQRDKDTVARKQTKLQQLITDVEQAANRWMSIVENDCLKLLNDLEKRIDQIDQIGHFEDALIFRAKELLARREEVFNFRRTARLNIPMDQLVAAMKKVFDTWQESFAVSKQLAEQIEGPLLSSYHDFHNVQRNVHAKYQDLEKLIPSQRTWPPNSLLLTVERNEIVQLEEKWQNLRNQPTSVIQFVRVLIEMSGSYRSLLEKFLQYEQWAIQEQSRIERIEADIYRLDRLWEIQQRRYGKVPEIEGQIRDIRERVEREITSLRQYWLTNASRRPPSVDYDVVLRKLIELSRQLANAKIVVVNEQGRQELMDINGQVILKT
ncbi:MAG: hypothetical protein N3D16_04420 [Anaerolineales bacterium]|nr:hypothetical protein [Anaerolineales bacterium]